ncbi:polysaccharide deacetylase family protein [Olleya namhaensis]|uniref:Polysaccharide deacetylase n=1 Tax=Olleya namhaensis TaxID=1144750 RepID=A0A1I3NJT4_9FLAO|nr:polysaccharide deacetylase family protein [Olleya namhaensis]SFJ09594.1 Polysaccharide deacetylase [Olleya namhaensis]
MLTVSNYHYIREDFKTKYPSIFGVTPLAFKKQLLLLQNRGEFIGSKDLLNNSEQLLSSKENYILITFDDGLKEQVDFGFSILNELNIPALFFANSINYQEKRISTVHKIHLLRSKIESEIILKRIENKYKSKLQIIDVAKIKAIYIYDDEKSAVLKYILNFVLDYKEQEEVINELFSNHFNENEVLNDLYMSTNNLQELANLGYLGSHTHSHYPLGLLPLKDITKELESSKNYFESLTKTKIDTVAYPYGTDEACTAEVSKLATLAGYKFGFTTKRGVNLNPQDKLLLNRFDCNDVIGGKNYKI